MLSRLLTALLPLLLVAGLAHTYIHYDLGNSTLEERCLPCSFGVSNSHAHQLAEGILVPVLIIGPIQPVSEVLSAPYLPSCGSLWSRGPPLVAFS